MRSVLGYGPTRTMLAHLTDQENLFPPPGYWRHGSADVFEDDALAAIDKAFVRARCWPMVVPFARFNQGVLDAR